MPSSPRDPDLGSGGLRTFLTHALPDARLTDAVVNAAYEPLLLMRTGHVIAAFAFANGDMRQSYEALYGGFKHYYAEQRGQWDALDLAFVFCVQPSAPQLDQFCSTVETDVYFCRKFVVPMAAPLGASLARLPFLPLSPLPGRSLRPASAQTFLQQCGVPALLAKFLVVQHERSPEGILEDCTSGKFGEPRQLTPVANAPVAKTERTGEPVRLETVEIRNFRAYRKLQTFAIGADVTVLYGPNGFGKTSFFDAVDFAVTGGIGRIESRRTANFAKTAQHLDSGSEESVVSLSFRSNGTVRQVTRSVSERTQALLDGRTTDRKAILAALTGGHSPATDRVENFVSLFRASHLFSQEQQELTKDFQDDCRLSAQIVSRMLAFEDYANAVSKAAKVREVAQTTIADANHDITELSGQIAAARIELERLGRTAKAHTNVEALDTEIAALRTKLIPAGVTVTPQKPNAAVVRGWRATLESRHAESQSASARLSVLAQEAAGLPRTRSELAAVQQRLAQKEQALNATEEKRVAAELELQRAEQRLAEMTAKCTDMQARAVLLEWVHNTKSAYVQLLEKERTLGDEAQRTTDLLTQQRAVEERAAGDLRTREAHAAQAAQTLKARRAELAAVQSLQESSTSWWANRTRLTAILQSEQSDLNSLESLRGGERELSPQAAALAAEETRLSRQIAEVDKRQSELRSLVSRLQGLVRTGICPLCGEDHGSKDHLVLRIQQHVAADAASGARADLTGVRERARQLAERVAANIQKQQAVHTQLALLKRERTRLETEIGQFANVAAELGVTIEADGPTLVEQLQARISRLQQAVADVDRQNHEANAAVEAARTAIANAKNLVAARIAEVTDRRTALARLQQDISRLRADPRLTQISLDIEPAQLAETERLSVEHLSAFRAEATKAEAAVATKKPEVSALRQEATSLKAQLHALRAQLANLQKAVTQITARLHEAKLPADASENTLLASIAEQSRVQAHLLALRDSASSLELAIDAATTAAALTTLLENVRDKEQAVTHTTAKRDLHRPWLKYFEDVSRLVSSEQNEAIATFTREYGPRTSVIQRRLRSVYGFDDIEIRSRESTISVRVKRHGEELRPTDYFSQSQQQTLLLGLFLTACSSQTWSAFSPVFLDDPVTHFDDLNTYAFLDLLVGLLDSDFGRRQFIISTCDEKLLQLARHKFRHLGARAKFYHFAALGADGPTVRDVFSHHDARASEPAIEGE
jgi:exonuclease SbcC